MGQGYTRQSAANIVTGNAIRAEDFNAEFNAIQGAFDGTVGHSHDGTSGEGAKILLTNSVTGILPVSNGGIGANTVAGMKENFNLGTISSQDYTSITITGGTISGITDLSIADGGTGASTVTAARANLGLSSMALQNSGGVSITGGSITGITDITIADGGTGASTATAARTNLGLGSLAVLSNINDANWLGTDLSIGNGGTGASDIIGARTNLGLGAVATLDAVNGDTWSGADLKIIDGGTGASDIVSARANLDVYSRSEVTTALVPYYTKVQVDASQAIQDAAGVAQDTVIASKLPLTGGTLSGPLTMNFANAYIRWTYPSVRSYYMQVLSNGYLRIVDESAGVETISFGPGQQYGVLSTYVTNVANDRALAYANDRVANLQYRHVSIGTCPAASNNYSYAPGGALIVGGYVSSSSITAVSSLRYVYPQVYDPVRGWVGFSQAY
jgi:hypothetical protein